MFFVGLQRVVLEVGEQRADFGIHHFVLDAGTHGEQFDNLSGSLRFLLDVILSQRLAWAPG
jgi:hypothetical protein